jgi:hypothetical protein
VRFEQQLQSDEVTHPRRNGPKPGPRCGAIAISPSSSLCVELSPMLLVRVRCATSPGYRKFYGSVDVVRHIVSRFI